MNRIVLTKNLFLDEYIPRELYNRYIGREHILISLLDERLIKADQALRDKFGPVTINNWFTGGNRNWSGLRMPESPDYSLTSQHSFGRASDKIFSLEPANVIQDYILSNWRELGITGLELNTSWVHTDVRNAGNIRLITFKA